MKKIYELKDITYGPFFYKDQIIVCNEQDEYLFFSADNYRLLHKVNVGGIYTIDILEGRIYLYNHDLYTYDDKTETFILYRPSLGGGFVILFNDYFIETKYDWDRDEVKVSFYKEASNDIQWTNIFRKRVGVLNVGRHLYITDTSLKYIDFIDALNGEVLNTLHFENPPISRFIYYYKDTLIVSLEIKPLEEYRLLGLDARTGEEKWRIEDADYRYIQDPMTGYLYDIGGKRFNVVDPGEGKILYKGDMTAENKKFDILPEWGILGKNSIYFIDNFPRSRVGRIDLKTYKIEFVVDLNFSNGVKITDLSYHNGRLYILDTDKTLHIFAEE